MALFRDTRPPRTMQPTVAVGTPVRDLWDVDRQPELAGETGRHANGRGEAGGFVDGEGGGGGGGGTGTSSGGTQVAASSDDTKNSSPEVGATLAAVAAFVVGLVVAVLAFKTGGGPTYAAPAGVGAFALFYVAAQSAERLVELVVPAFEKVDLLGKAGKEVERDKKIETALVALDDPATTDTEKQQAATAAADAQAAIDQARANRTVVAFGATAAVGMMLCGYLEADFLTAVGVKFTEPGAVEQTIMMAVTGLIVGGGSKGLHDLLANVSKSSERKSTPPETGGGG